jgi:hypothetical protein
MSKVYEPVKNFYILAPYFLEDLLGLGCWGLDYDEIGKNLSMSETKINKILDDVKLQEQNPFYKLFPIFQIFECKHENTEKFKEMNLYYWNLLKDEKVPEKFFYLVKNNAISLLNNTEPISKDDFSKVDLINLTYMLTKRNRKTNVENSLKIYE